METLTEVLLQDTINRKKEKLLSLKDKTESLEKEIQSLEGELKFFRDNNSLPIYAFYNGSRFLIKVAEEPSLFYDLVKEDDESITLNPNSVCLTLNPAIKLSDLLTSGEYKSYHSITIEDCDSYPDYWVKKEMSGVTLYNKNMEGRLRIFLQWAEEALVCEDFPWTIENLELLGLIEGYKKEV